jgi:hypothetical protein
MADYHSTIAKAVSALDLNTEKARRRLYERARAALRSKMHGAYPPFHRSEIAAAEMSLGMAIEAVEAEAVREQNAKFATLAASPLRASVSVTPSPSANEKGEVRLSLTTLWAAIFRRADDGALRSGEAISDHSKDGTDGGGRTWLTQLLDRASREVDNDEQDFIRRRKTARQTGSVGDNAEPYEPSYLQ